MSAKIYGAAAGALIVTLALTAGRQYARAELAERKLNNCAKAYVEQNNEMQQAKHEVEYFVDFLTKAGYRIER